MTSVVPRVVLVAARAANGVIGLYAAASAVGGFFGRFVPGMLAEQFGWRIDILPRLGHRAGLELGAGVALCTVAPEDAAAQLQEA